MFLLIIKCYLYLKNESKSTYKTFDILIAIRMSRYTKFYEIRVWIPNSTPNKPGDFKRLAYYDNIAEAFECFKNIWRESKYLDEDLHLVESYRDFSKFIEDDKEYQCSVDYNNNNMAYMKWLWNITTKKNSIELSGPEDVQEMFMKLCE